MPTAPTRASAEIAARARRDLACYLVTLGLCVLGQLATSLRPAMAQEPLPPRLTDDAFWSLSNSLSEPNGFFQSDNLTSNELGFQRVIPDLLTRIPRAGVYLGVGPEQNFTYIAATDPAMAVIVDIRRDNLVLQLMYKAIFELSDTRVDFVETLFSKPRPEGITAAATARDLFTRFAPSTQSDALYQKNIAAIRTHLVTTHHFPLTRDDLDSLERIFHAFYSSGFAVRYQPTYADLMVQTDGTGTNRSFLSSEENYRIVKMLEAKNLIVPVVGDFAGPKALRGVGAYLRAHGRTVSTFYLSNVEQYLFRNDVWATFCENAATLPVTPASTFIRSMSGGGGMRGGVFISALGTIEDEVKTCR